MKPARGFTLIELMVTVSLVAVLMSVVAPFLGNAIANARARNIVSKFRQDFSWARNLAGTSGRAVTLTLKADCSWSSTVEGTVDASHSLTATELAASASAMSCTGNNTTALPVTMTFTSQGFVAPGATFVFNGPNAQTWPIQILGSGSVIVTRGAS